VGKSSAPISTDSRFELQSDNMFESSSDEDDEIASPVQEEEASETIDVRAPSYTVPARPLGAVEVPGLISDVDRGMKAFGNIYNYDQVRLTRTLKSKTSC
jgi:hypothetical protein